MAVIGPSNLLREAVAETIAPRASVAVADPMVSIGMPVFNGQNFLRKAIDSVLAQTFCDFELIISDNASIDETAAICHDYADRDARVRYVRNAHNVGAGPNFDRCFALARGRYFQWAAHDDMFAPDFLERAVAALEAQPDAVLCTAGIVEIDANDTVIRTFATDLDDATSADRVRRFACVIHTRHQCEDFFGLYRREALVGTGLIGTYSGSDRVLLAEMALRGRWVRLNAPLFLHRDHAQRATRALLLVDHAAALRWQNGDDRDDGGARHGEHFHLTLYRHYWRVVQRSVPPGERAACYRELLRWWATDGHSLDVVRDLLRSIDPHLLVAARTLKRALVGTHRDLRPGSLPTLER